MLIFHFPCRIINLAKPLALVFVLSLMVLQAQAQPGGRWRQETHRETSFLLKLGAYSSPVPRMLVGGSVEFKVGEAATIQGDAQIGLPLKLKEQNVSQFHSGFQYRYYFRGYEPFEGLYAGPVLGYNVLSFSNSDLKTNASFFSFPFGLGLGYHVPVNSHVVVDLNSNVGFSPGSLTIGYGTADDFPVRDYNALFFKLGLAVGFGW